MNIKQIIVLIILHLPMLIEAQNMEYYKHINNAELNIIDGQYKLAHLNYNKAFKYMDAPKVIDVINALKCGCLSDGLNNDLVNILERRTLSVSKLREDKILKKCLTNNRSTNLAFKLDETYRTQINRLDSLDQLYRTKKGSYKKYKNEIDSLDEINVNNLLEYIKEKGFPSESVIGVENKGGYQGWMIVVWHYQQKRSLNKDIPDVFSKVLTEALLHDHISPLQYSILIELQNDSTYLKYTATPIIIIDKGHYRILGSTLENIDSINKQRADIGLYSLEDYIKKIIYHNKNAGHFNFGINNGVFDLSDQDKAFKKQIRQISVEVEFKKGKIVFKNRQ